MLSVVIPAYNEAKHLNETITTVQSFLKKNIPSWELIISEDGSTDDSYRIAKGLARNDPRIKVLHSGKRLGKGGGIREGIKASKGNIILFYDADMAVPVTEIKKHLPLLRKYDFVIGSRSIDRSRIEKRQPFYREWLGVGFRNVIRLLLGIPFEDTQCGFKYFKREVLTSILPQLKVDGFAFDVEILSLAMKKGYKGTAVPVVWRHMEGSKVNVARAVPEMLFDALKIAIRTRLS